MNLSSELQDYTTPSLLLYPKNGSRDLHCTLTIRLLTEQDSCSTNRPLLSSSCQYFRLWKPPNPPTFLSSLLIPIFYTIKKRWCNLKCLTCMQCIAKPGPVYSFLWHIWHLKCFAFWCCIRIFSSSKSLLQYLLNMVKEAFNPESDLLYNTKLISFIVIFLNKKKRHRKHLWTFKDNKYFRDVWNQTSHTHHLAFPSSGSYKTIRITYWLTHAFQVLVIPKWTHSFSAYQ